MLLSGVVQNLLAEALEKRPFLMKLFVNSFSCRRVKWDCDMARHFLVLCEFRLLRSCIRITPWPGTASDTSRADDQVRLLTFLQSLNAEVRRLRADSAAILSTARSIGITF